MLLTLAVDLLFMNAREPVEEIAEQFLARLRAGESVSIEDYLDRYPQYASQISALFPTLLLMEDVKPREPNPLRSRDSTDTLLERNLQRLGDYRIVRRIGYGGMGIVYEAEQESLGRRVAMKIFAPTLFSSERQIRRFQREAQAAAKLHHSNIVPVLGVGEQWGIHYYIMQFIVGRSLDQVLRDRSDDLDAHDPFRLHRDWSRIASVGHQLAEAIDYAHSQGVLHRDIKPGNVLLDENGTAWITDFGLAKLLEHDEGFTRTGQTLGTLRYMAPEQLGGKVDARSDIYALGLTLYELITWQPAFDETDQSQLVRQKSTHAPTRPTSIDPQIPRDLETIVLKAMAREPRHRYQTSRALHEDLDRFLQDLPIHARRVSAAERLYRWSRRNPALASAFAMILGLALSIAAIAGWSYWRVQGALREATEGQARAVAASELATGALDSIFERFGIESIEANPGIEPTLSSEAAVLLEQLIRYYDQLADDDSSNPELLYKAAEAQLRIGNIHSRLGEYADAMSAYEEAAHKFEQLEKSDQRQLKLARLKNHQGQVRRWMGQSSEAMHREAINILEPLQSPATGRSTGWSGAEVAGWPLAAQARYERARSHYLLATRVRPGMGPESLPPMLVFGVGAEETSPSSPEMRQWLELAETDLRPLVRQFPDQPAVSQLLARCLRERAGDRLPTREREEQLAEQQAIAILQSLVEKFPDRLEFEFDLLETLAEINVFEGLQPKNLGTIRDRLRKAVALGEALVTKRPDVALYASSVIHVHFKLARVELQAAAEATAERRDQYVAAAAQHMRAAVNRQTELIRRFPTAVGFAAWQALFRQQLAALLVQQGDLDEAQYQATAAIFLIEELLQLSAEPVLGMIADAAYRTLNQVFIEEGTPPGLLPNRGG